MGGLDERGREVRLQAVSDVVVVQRVGRNEPLAKGLLADVLSATTTT